MKAPNEILSAWKLQREHGDVEQIHKATKISRITITGALNTGNMSKSTFESIKDFFKKKRTEKSKLIKEALK